MYKLARTFELFEPLQERIRNGMATFGTCAGMIMLADRVIDGTNDQETLGGLDITVRRNAFGRQVDSFEAAVAIDDIPGGDFHAVFIRAPWVEKVGAEVSVLGRVTAGPAAGRIVAVRQGNREAVEALTRGLIAKLLRQKAHLGTILGEPLLQA
mgnify:CR=1 FL=1